MKKVLLLIGACTFLLTSCSTEKQSSKMKGCSQHAGMSGF